MAGTVGMLMNNGGSVGVAYEVGFTEVRSVPMSQWKCPQSSVHVWLLRRALMMVHQYSYAQFPAPK